MTRPRLPVGATWYLVALLASGCHAAGERQASSDSARPTAPAPATTRTRDTISSASSGSADSAEVEYALLSEDGVALSDEAAGCQVPARAQFWLGAGRWREVDSLKAGCAPPRATARFELRGRWHAVSDYLSLETRDTVRNEFSEADRAWRHGPDTLETGWEAPPRIWLRVRGRAP